MCGIVYAHSKEPVNNIILNLFDAQRARGLQGFGLFDGQEKNIVRETTEEKILKWLVKYESKVLLFHHRFPTSTPNVRASAHPFATKDFFKNTQYILVHNGHITNARGLKLEHEKMGIEYRSEMPDSQFNDSEALLWDVALYLEGRQPDIKAVGAMAWICIKLTKGKLDKIYFGRNINPLNMVRVRDSLALSSEGAGDPITPNTLYTYSYKLNRLTSKSLWMPSYYQQTELPPRTVPRYLAEPEEEVKSDVTVREVEDKMYYYLYRNSGRFYEAHQELEDDYYTLAEDCETAEEYHEMRVLEAAEEMLWTDPEWTSNSSISSDFKPRGLRT